MLHKPNWRKRRWRWCPKVCIVGEVDQQLRPWSKGDIALQSNVVRASAPKALGRDASRARPRQIFVALHMLLLQAIQLGDRVDLRVLEHAQDDGFQTGAHAALVHEVEIVRMRRLHREENLLVPQKDDPQAGRAGVGVERAFP